jgi:hypothetical protein
MNKSLLALLLGVCVVGMGLLMYQEKQDISRPEKPIQNDAAVDRRTSPPLPAPQELSAVPVAPQTERPSMPAQAGRFADTLPLSGERTPAAEKAPVAETASALPVETRPASAAEPPTRQAAHVPVVPVLPDASASSSGQSVKAVETPQRSGIGKNAKLVVFARDKGATVRLAGGAPVRYQTMTLTGPDRVVVDVEGLTGLKAPGVPKNPVVSNVRLGAADGKTRIVIDLAGKPGHIRFVLSKEKDTLDIRIDQ